MNKEDMIVGKLYIHLRTGKVVLLHSFEKFDNNNYVIVCDIENLDYSNSFYETAFRYKFEPIKEFWDETKN